MVANIIIGILSVLVIALGGAVFVSLRALTRLKETTKKVDQETHLLSMRLDYLRREMEKRDPDAGGNASPGWLPLPGPQSLASEPPFLDQREIDRMNAPPVRLPLPRVEPEARPFEMPRSEIIPDLQPPVQAHRVLEDATSLQPSAMLEAEPTVLPGSDEPAMSVDAWITGAQRRFDEWLAVCRRAILRERDHICDWILVRDEFGAQATSEIVARVWQIRVSMILLVGALVVLGLYLAPSMESEEIAVLGCLGGMGCMILAVTVSGRRSPGLGALFVCCGLIVTTLTLRNAAWALGVVSNSWAVVVLVVAAMVSILSGEHRASLLMTGTGMAVAFSVPLLMMKNGISQAAAGSLCVVLNALIHRALTRRIWPLLRCLVVLYGYGFLVFCIRSPFGSLVGPGLGTVLVFLFITQNHFAIRIRPHTEPAVRSVLIGLNGLGAMLTGALLLKANYPGLYLVVDDGWIALWCVAMLGMYATQANVLGSARTLLFATGVWSVGGLVLALFEVIRHTCGLTVHVADALHRVLLNAIIMAGAFCFMKRYDQSGRRDLIALGALFVCLTLALIKTMGVDFIHWQPQTNLIFGAPYGVRAVVVRCLDVGILLAGFLIVARRLAATLPASAAALIGMALIGIFVHASLEVNTYFYVKSPAFRAAGLSLLWGFFGVLLAVAGARMGRHALRQAGWLFLGVAVVKVLAVDMGRMDRPHGVIALVTVAVFFLLGAATSYLRPKQTVAATVAVTHEESDHGHA